MVKTAYLIISITEMCLKFWYYLKWFNETCETFKDVKHFKETFLNL